MTFIDWMKDQDIEVELLTLEQTDEHYRRYIRMYGLDI